MEVALPASQVTWPINCSTGSTATSQVQSQHNALGQRAVKTVNSDPATAIHFIYDQTGQVIAEIDAATGTTLREYIYVNGQQIALVDDTGTAIEATYFVHNDHLGTPQKITDSSQVVVWGGSYEPFGEVEKTVDFIENSIRFPGQYEDGENGLHYNYFRDYDPSLGRYVESDPIGLNGGNNVYIYALNEPINNIDPSGLASLGFGGNIPFFFGFGFGGEVSLINLNCCENGKEIERVFLSIEAGPSFGSSLRVGPGIGFNLSTAGLGACTPPRNPRFRLDFGPFSGTDANTGLDVGTRKGLAVRANIVSVLKELSSTPTGKCC